MSSDYELLPTAQATPSPPPPLTGKARASARAEAWRQKQRDKFDEEIAQIRFNRSFHWEITPEDEAAFQQQLLDIAGKREEERENHEEKVEPTIDPECEEFQTLDLPAVTVPLASSIQETFNCFRQRIGPSLDDWCPIESLYRFSTSQFLHFVDPVKYDFLAPLSAFENFDCIVRAIQLNEHYFNDDFEINPVINHLDPRCITVESIDRFRRISTSELELIAPSVVDFDLNFFRSTNRDGRGVPLQRFEVHDDIPCRPIIPDDFTIEDLIADAHSVRKLLRFVLSSDSDYYRPRRLCDPLLPKAPYLAIINQLPARELARRVTSKISTTTFPRNSKLTFPLEIRVIGNDGYIYLMNPTAEDAEVLTTMVRSGDLPSGSDSAWDGVDSDDDGW